MKFLNQHSFTLTAVAAILIFTYLSLRGGVRLYQLALLGILIIGLAVLYLRLRPVSSTLSDADQVIAEIGSGTPVLLEFQSQY